MGEQEMNNVTIYTIDDLFKPLNEWTDIILRSFSKMEVHAYRLTREFVIELLLFVYNHDRFRRTITSPLLFKTNFQELYGVYMAQWEK